MRLKFCLSLFLAARTAEETLGIPLPANKDLHLLAQDSSISFEFPFSHDYITDLAQSISADMVEDLADPAPTAESTTAATPAAPAEAATPASPTAAPAEAGHAPTASGHLPTDQKVGHRLDSNSP